MQPNTEQTPSVPPTTPRCTKCQTRYLRLNLQTHARCTRCIVAYRAYLDAVFTQPYTTHYVAPRKRVYNDHTPTQPTSTQPITLRTPTRRYDKVITCNNHSCHHTTRDSNYHYVTYTMPIANAPHHCPSCHTTKISVRDLDYADTIIQQHPRFNRPVALRFLSELAKLNSRRSQASQLNAEDALRKMAPAGTHAPSHGITPLMCMCRSCGGTFTLLRTIPTTHTPVTYCVWCGQSDQLSITQCNTEETHAIAIANTTVELQFDAMAAAYSMPVKLVKLLYTHWSSTSNIPFFSTFLQSDEVQTLVAQLHAKQQKG